MAEDYEYQDELKLKARERLDLIHEHIHDLPLDRLKRAHHNAMIDEREDGRMVLDEADEDRLNISAARRSIYQQELEKRGIPREAWFQY